jgi:hypothetical protein
MFVVLVCRQGHFCCFRKRESERVAQPNVSPIVTRSADGDPRKRAATIGGTVGARGPRAFKWSYDETCGTQLSESVSGEQKWRLVLERAGDQGAAQQGATQDEERSLARCRQRRRRLARVELKFVNSRFLKRQPSAVLTIES